MNIKKPIFLDNQSTTPLDQRVFEMMVPYFKDEFGNPHSSHHIYGRTASTAIEAARKKIANCLNTNYQDIYFTSGATESNNLLIKGLGNYSTAELIQFELTSSRPKIKRSVSDRRSNLNPLTTAASLAL